MESTSKHSTENPGNHSYAEPQVSGRDILLRDLSDGPGRRDGAHGPVAVLSKPQLAVRARRDRRRVTRKPLGEEGKLGVRVRGGGQPDRG